MIVTARVHAYSCKGWQVLIPRPPSAYFSKASFGHQGRHCLETESCRYLKDPVAEGLGFRV